MHAGHEYDGPGGPAAQQAAVEMSTATVLAALAGDHDVPVTRIAEVIREAVERRGAEPLRIGMLAIAAPELASAPTSVALSAHVALLAGLTGTPAVAVWRLEGDDELRLVAWTGDDGYDEDDSRPAARAALDGEPGERSAIVISAFGAPCAALVWVGGGPDPAMTRTLAIRSAMALGLAFERAALLDGTVAQQSALGRSAERRLSRMAFDLHDGPMQDLALLCAELHRVRGALDATLGPSAAHGGTVGASGRRAPCPRSLIDDVLAIAEATSSDLRELATSMESSTLLQRPFPEALHGIARAYALRSAVEPEIELEGDVTTLTDMERVTLLRVIGEALTNAREHSAATHVTVRVRVTPSRVEASVRDDGAGFDVEATMPVAARRGSLGLLGMIERVRLMDGRCDVLSRPGQGTTVALSIARLAPALRVGHTTVSGPERTPAAA